MRTLNIESDYSNVNPVSKYWIGKGNYQKLLINLSKKLVPPYGKSNTEIGELLRTSNLILGDIYKNNMTNYDDYEFLMSYSYSINGIKDKSVKFKNKILEIISSKSTTFSNLNNKNLIIELDNFLDSIIVHVKNEYNQIIENNFEILIEDIEEQLNTNKKTFQNINEVIENLDNSLLFKILNKEIDISYLTQIELDRRGFFLSENNNEVSNETSMDSLLKLSERNKELLKDSVIAKEDSKLSNLNQNSKDNDNSRDNLKKEEVKTSNHNQKH